MTKKIVMIVCNSILLIISIVFGIRVYAKYLVGYQDVYIASHNISQRTIIKEEDLIKVEVPRDFVGDDVYTNKDDMIGKYVKLSSYIPKGSLIYKNFLEDDIKDLAHTLLKKGEVNYDLYVSETKINTSNIDVGMYLDLYLTISSSNEVISDLLIKNCRITGLYDNNNKQILDYMSDAKVYIISIAVKEEDVKLLNIAAIKGTINSIVKYNTYNENLSSSMNYDSPIFSYLN